MRCDYILLHRKGNRYKHRCIRCGRETQWTLTETNPYAVCKKRGLGDKIERIIKLFVFRPRCGGCQRRKDKLNNLDRKLFRLLRGPKNGKYTVP
jgi:hypothetical protein